MTSHALNPLMIVIAFSRSSSAIGGLQRLNVYSPQLLTPVLHGEIIVEKVLSVG